jgi:hypothetical protein
VNYQGAEPEPNDTSFSDEDDDNTYQSPESYNGVGG